MLVRDGMTTKDDILPKRYYEPVVEGPAQGEVILREAFDKMLDEYYRLHGWDGNGVPKKETIRRLGLDEGN